MNEEFDWYQIKYLESTQNLIDLIQQRSRITISSSVAVDIAVNLQQGRAFFEQSEEAALEIKPLLLFYGMLAFARAVIISRLNVALDMLVPRHGLSDPTTLNNSLASLEVKVQLKGTFPELIDSTRELEKVIVYHRDKFTETRLPHPPDYSSALNGKTLTIKEILARISGLGNLYVETFGDVQKVIECGVFELDDCCKTTRLIVVDRSNASDRASIQRKITTLRTRYPFLNQWAIMDARKNGRITFCSWPRNELTEFSADSSREDFLDIVWHQPTPIRYDCLTDPRPRVPPIYGNLLDKETKIIIEPVHGVHVSEFALYYAGMYLLSSLVRYRPTIWANAIARRPLGSLPPDDRPLAVIEHFLQLAAKRFPRMTVNAIRKPD